MIVAFKAEHAEHLCMNAVDSSLGEHNREQWRAWAKYNEKAGMAFTGMENGVPVWAAGIRYVREGVVNMWAVFAQDAPKSIYRALSAMLPIGASRGAYRKLRSESRIGFDASQRILEHLGFKRQRRNANPDHYLYIRRA